ncbi:MAG: ABC transporter permease [Alkaliphilus sp.]
MSSDFKDKKLEENKIENGLLSSKRNDENNKNGAKNRIDSPTRVAFRRLKKSKMSMISLAVISFFILMAAFAPFVTPFEYNDLNMRGNEISANLVTFQIDEDNFVLYKLKDHSFHAITENAEYIERVDPVKRNREERYNVYDFDGKEVIMDYSNARDVGFPIVTVDGQAVEMQKRWNRTNILGTDNLGRCVYTRIVYGARISLSVGLVAVAIRVFLGILIGSIAGYYGGKIDNILMRFADMVMCFPQLLIIITIIVIVGPSIFNVMIVLGVLGWPGIARIVRGQILSLREQEFMEAAEALGLSDFRKIFRHLLPNIMASVVVFATIGIAGAILTEAALSFLGLGVQPPTPSWGNMIQAARSIYALQRQWWLWVPPGLAIFVTVMSFNILGDGLRDALDPKLKK